MIEAALPAARAVHFAATLSIEGCVVFQFLLAAHALGGRTKDGAGFERFVYRTLIVAWIVAVLSGAAWLLLLAAELADTSVAEAMSDGTTWTLLTETQFGWSWIARGVGFALLLTCLSRRFRRQPQTPLMPAKAGIQLDISLQHVSAGSPLSRGRAEGWPARGSAGILIALSLALTGSLAWSGHGAATPGAAGALHLAADILHLIAAGIWLGGLLPFMMLLKLCPDSAAETARRFSSIATACVLVLGASGIVNGWMILGGLDALTGTFYGRLLLAKLALFLLMLAFAGVNRLVLTPRLAIANLSGNARSRLVIHSGCEIALGLAILALVGLLGTLAPMPEEQHQHAFARAALL